jgi:cell division FtsZ-interacting protein ZapD
LWIKNDLRAPVEDSRAVAPHSSPTRAARGRGPLRDKPLSPIRKIFSLLFGMCKFQLAADVRAQHERRERRKITISVKEIRTHLDLQPPNSALLPRVKKARKLSSLKKGLLALMKKLWCSSGMTM